MAIPSPLQRWSSTWSTALVASAVAASAWAVAHQGLGHRSPIFAPIAALVCLSPGVASRGRQAIRMLIGVTIGIAVGDAALALSATPSWYWLGAATTIALLAASTVGVTAVTFIQAGGSVVIVIASGRAAGVERFTDCAVGGLFGLLVSQVLLSPDPLALLEKNASVVHTHLAEGWQNAKTALDTNDAEAAARALASFEAALRAVTTLEDTIVRARGIAAWTVRGRLATKGIRAATARYERTPLLTCAASTSFGLALVRALSDVDRDPAPPALAVAAAFASRPSEIEKPMPALDLEGPARWRECTAAMKAVLAVLSRDSGSSP